MIRHKRLDIFKIGKSIHIIKRINFMGVSEFDVDSCIALELSCESLARNLESDFKRALKVFRIPLSEASHLLRTRSGQSEWYLGEAWDTLEERISEFSASYDFTRETVPFPKFVYTPRAKSVYVAECIWAKRWYKRNKDLESSGRFHNSLQLLTENSTLENVWSVGPEQFNASFMPHDDLENTAWWQSLVSNLQAQSRSELSQKYFMHQAQTCFEGSIIITFNSSLEIRSAFEVENPHDLLMEKLFAEALEKFRLTQRVVLN
jgi:hypothetical protein